MKSFWHGVFGGILGAMLVGVAVAHMPLFEGDALQGAIIRAGSVFSWPSTTENNTTALAVNGSIMFNPGSSGPGYGSGRGGMQYRNTGETNMDPSLVMRFKTYTFEGEDLTWLANITPTGLCVGCLVNDSGTFPAYPQYKLDVRGDMRQAGAGETFFRIGSKSSSTSVNVGYLFERAGTPVWAMGILPGMCGTGNANDLVLCKFNGSSWVRVATLGTY